MITILLVIAMICTFVPFDQLPNFYLSKETKRLADERTKYKVYCKCGHSMIIFPFEHRVKKICSYCGNYAYVNEFEKFKEKLNESIKKKEALYEKCY